VSGKRVVLTSEVGSVGSGRSKKMSRAAMAKSKWVGEWKREEQEGVIEEQRKGGFVLWKRR